MTEGSGMSEIKLLALIITYNRLPLLKECIQAVLGQTWNSFDILVIDNHSTDGTWEYLQALEGKDSISFLRQGQNTGGSGGFHIGIREALRRGYSHIWLMDDDTVPDSHAAERLLSADRLLGKYGFLVSLPIWKDGSLCKMNLPLPGQFRREKGRILQEGLLPVRKATFVSMLLKAEIVREVGLPIKEFFIWGDDQEYTERISKKYKCYLVLSSVVQHKTKNNLGSDISTDSPERIERYFYAYRNELYIAKRNGILSLGFYFVRAFYSLIKILLFSKERKWTRVLWLFRGIISGLTFKPEPK